MNVLLIDDKADKGWKQLLEKIFPIQDMKVDTAMNFSSAKEKIKDRYELIFLDMRLTSGDHQVVEIEEYTGFKILKKIKSDFENKNFSTPIFLLTASNKIWNVDAFMQYGADTYYIKEHPDYVLSKQVSKEKYKKFKNDFMHLLSTRKERYDIWSLSMDILEIMDDHKYFNNNSGYKNVKERIVDKLKLGYYYRFKGQNTLEKEVLKVDNESISFLIYFSILEELVKGYTKKKTWDKDEFLGNWEFRNNKLFISESDNGFEVEPVWDKDKKENIKKMFGRDNKTYINGYINLSEQMYALMYHYNIEDECKSDFTKLNNFRNKLSYTHSSIACIYEKPLVQKEDKDKLNEKIKSILKLIIEILKQPSVVDE